jgi:hypothetical protein
VTDRFLILAPTPFVRDLPFYGHAVECCQGTWPVKHRLMHEQLDQFDAAVEMRTRLERELRIAESVVGKIKSDIAAIDATWPNEERKRP